MALPSTPDRQPPLSAYDEMVEIKVGTGDGVKSFSMHKGILSFYSGYFQGAVKGQFRDTQEGVLTLEAVKPQVFERFQAWAYQRSIKGLTKEGSFKQLAELWIFADEHLIPLLQNEVLNLYREETVESWSYADDALILAYERTAPESGLRRFIAERRGKDIEGLRDLPKEALVDLLCIVWAPEQPLRSREDLRDMDMCDYHVHERGVRCSRAKKRKLNLVGGDGDNGLDD